MANSSFKIPDPRIHSRDWEDSMSLDGQENPLKTYWYWRLAVSFGYELTYQLFPIFLFLLRQGRTFRAKIESGETFHCSCYHSTGVGR